MTLDHSADHTVPEVRFLTIYPLVVLPLFLAMVDQSIVASALPQIAQDFGTGASTTWVLVAYLMAAAISAPVVGRIADAFGLRLMLVVGLGVAIAGSLLCALAPQFEWLLAARILQGVGGGAIHAISLAVINKTVPAKQRAKYQGFIASVSVTANMAGPLIGAFITHYFGWKAVFLVTPPLALLALAFAGRLDKRLNSRMAFRFDTLGFLALSGMVSSLFGLLFTLSPPYDRVTNLGLLCLCGMSGWGLVFLWAERRAVTPLLPLGILAEPSIWRCNLMALCQGAMVGGLVATAPLYFTIMRQVDQASIGWAILPMTIGLGLGGITWGQVVGRTGRTAAVTASAMSCAVLLIWIGVGVWPHLRSDAVSLWLGVVSWCVGSIMVVVQVTISNRAGRNLQATASGVVNLFRSIGAALGGALVASTLNGTVYFLIYPNAAPDFATVPHAILNRAFGISFIVISAFSLGCALLAATLPMRRIP